MLTTLAGYPYLFGSLFLLLVVGGGALMVWLAEHSALAPHFQKCAGLVGPFASLLALMFSLFVVFVATDIWNQRDKAEEAVAKQADSIRILRVVAAGLGDNGQALGRLIGEFGNAQTAPGWEEPNAQRTIANLLQRLHDQVLFGDASRGEALVRRAATDAILVVGEMHRDLHAAATNETSWQKWGATLVLAVLSQIALVLVHLGKPRSSYVANVLYSISVAFIMWVTLVRVDPFYGVNPVSLEPIALAAQGM